MAGLIAAAFLVALPLAVQTPALAARNNDPFAKLLLNGDAAEGESATDKLYTGREPELEADLRRDPSVVSLQADLNISETDAFLQMQNQLATQIADAEMPAILSSSFAGREINHRRGGEVVVAITDPSVESIMRQYYESRGVSRLRFASAVLNDEQLDALVATLRERLRQANEGQLGDSMRVGRSSPGRVSIDLAPNALNKVETAIVNEALAAPGVFAMRQVERIPKPAKENCDVSGDIECDPPLRGSQRIFARLDGRTPVCTAGFNVRSRSDQKPYILTAGHCRADDFPAATWDTNFENGQLHAIGPFHNHIKSRVTDTGIVRVNKPDPQPAGWSFGRPWITVSPNRDGHTREDAYVIRRALDPGDGDRVCITAGNTAATTCSFVEDPNDSADGTDGLVRTEPGDICAQGGDSGSPYFSLGTALGIHTAGVPGELCTDSSWFEHIGEAAAAMNVYVLTGS